MKQVPHKLFGLQRTCTNLVRWLMRENFPAAQSMEIGMEWKHGHVTQCADKRVDGEPIRLLFCFRNPYAWLPSCHRLFREIRTADPAVCPNFRAYNWDFPEFIHSEHYCWDHPIKRWNEMNRHWLRFYESNPDKCYRVISERLMTREGAAEVLVEIQVRFGLQAKDPHWHIPDRRVRIDSRLEANQMNREYFTEKHYLANYTAEMLAFVNEQLDWGIMQELGYQQETA